MDYGKAWCGCLDHRHHLSTSRVSSSSIRPGDPSRNGLPSLRSGHAKCKILLRILIFMIRRLRAALAFPTTNPISIGSIVQGTHRIPTLMASIKVQHGSLPKPIWKMAASWFSIRPDKRRTQLDPAADRKPQQGRGSCAPKSANRDQMMENKRLRP